MEREGRRRKIEKKMKVEKKMRVKKQKIEIKNE